MSPRWRHGYSIALPCGTGGSGMKSRYPCSSLALLALLAAGHYGGLHFLPHEVRWGHMTGFGQWNVTGSQVCPFYGEKFKSQCGGVLALWSPDVPTNECVFQKLQGGRNSLSVGCWVATRKSVALESCLGLQWLICPLDWVPFEVCSDKKKKC